MRLVRGLFAAHLGALVFGLSGLLIALPHPELWNHSRQAARVFNFGMTYAGSLHILLGAAAVFAFGTIVIGARKTFIFFLAATTLSLCFELVGTGTGWPFGNYAYTSFLGRPVVVDVSFLGLDIDGRVPFTIPLSWFYMGFTSYLLARVILAVRGGRVPAWGPVLLGVWFLTVWDLVLDPAMAHESMPVRFWIWEERGPYFGMPVQNFVGWSVTGLAFMALSRWLWRAEAPVERIAVWFPFGMYAANMIFAMALSLSVGLWQPVLLGAVLGLLPAALVWRAPASPAARGAGRLGRSAARG